jgi:hypothetical protein
MLKNIIDELRAGIEISNANFLRPSIGIAPLSKDDFRIPIELLIKAV